MCFLGIVAKKKKNKQILGIIHCMFSVKMSSWSYVFQWPWFYSVMFLKEDERKSINIIHYRIKNSMCECTERTKMMWMQRLGKLSASTYKSTKWLGGGGIGYLVPNLYFCNLYFIKFMFFFSLLMNFYWSLCYFIMTIFSFKNQADKRLRFQLEKSDSDWIWFF